MTELEEHLEIDKQKIIDAVRLQMPIEVTTYTLPKNMEAYFRGVEKIFLETCHQEHLIEYMNFSLGELLTNSKKANTKRIYFQEKNLDINDPDDYAVGMEHFKDDTFANIDYYLELQRKAGLYIKLSLQYVGDNVIIEIRNNSVLTKYESERIQQKLECVQQYNSIDEVVTNVLDQSEGAGLGIIIIILMLQKAGLSRENFRIFSDDKETITQIILPCDKTVQAGVDIISYEFVNLQTKIPVLKNNFEKALKYTSSQKLKRKPLFEIIRKDVTLSFLLVEKVLEKGNPCFNLQEAMELLSDDEVREVYSVNNSKLQVIENTEKLNSLWNHAARTAYISYNLYKNMKDNNSEFDGEYFYLAGLLNSLGRIFMENASEEQKQCIQILSSNYEDISERIKDIFRFGSADKYVSELYVKKSGFPVSMQKTFGHWNDSKTYCMDNNVVGKLLYLSEMMEFYNEKAVEYYQINQNVLNFFGISEEKQFKTIIKKLS